MATIEQVEKLREKANVSYDEAKAALDASNGDILDAMIYLEKQGKVKEPDGGGQFSSKHIEAAPQNSSQQQQATDNGQTFTDLLKRFGRFLAMLIRKGNANSFEIVSNDEIKAVIPVTALVLLLIFAFWVTIPLLIIGLFFNFRYRFKGPDLGTNPVNSAMDSAAKTAQDIKESVKNEGKQQ